MGKKVDKRIESFRDKAKDFVSENFCDMKDAYELYMSKPETYDKGVALFMKIMDKVIPSMPTQSDDSDKTEKPAWQQKVDKAKKTYENDTK